MKVDKEEAESLPRIRDFVISPEVNPLIEPNAVPVKRRYVRSGINSELVDTNTGELSAVSMIHTIEEKDDMEFVKVFAAGVAASYDITKAGQRVFQAVLAEYGNTPMSRGFADAVELFWFGNGLAGRDIGMSEPTFNRGLRELLAKRFLYPRSRTTYWVNPSLFFKGNRVMFIREYVKKRSGKDQELREALEKNGQKRLTE